MKTGFLFGLRWLAMCIYSCLMECTHLPIHLPKGGGGGGALPTCLLGKYLFALHCAAKRTDNTCIYKRSEQNKTPELPHLWSVPLSAECNFPPVIYRQKNSLQI